MAIYQTSDFDGLTFQVGTHSDENGNPLVVVDGKVIGRVDWILKFLGQYWLEKQRAEAVPEPDWLIGLRAA